MLYLMIDYFFTEMLKNCCFALFSKTEIDTETGSAVYLQNQICDI